jgi:hypothetical protein
LVDVAGSYHIHRAAWIALNQGSSADGGVPFDVRVFQFKCSIIGYRPPVKDDPAVIFTPLHSNCMPLLTLNIRIPLPVILVLAPSARMTRFLVMVIGLAPMSIVCPANTALIFTVSPGAAQLIAAGRLPVPVPDV